MNIKKPLTIWLLQTGEPLQCDSPEYRSMRAINLSNKLLNKGHNVEIFSSSFFHQKKVHRSKTFKTITINTNLKVHLIPSPGYKKNISINRLLDHLILGFNLSKYIDTLKEKPDIGFIGFPPIEASFFMARYLNKINVPYVLDLKDMWPSLFIQKFPFYFRFIAKIIFYPYTIMTLYAIRNANSLTSMSDSFLKWFSNYSKRELTVLDKSFPLTSPLKKNSNFTAPFNSDLQNIVLKNNDIVFTFVGSFMSVFDFSHILFCAKENPDYKFILAGDGSYRKSTQEQFKATQNVYFPGWINTQEILYLSSISKGSLIPYKNIENYQYNLPNKVVDALYLGIPIVTSLTGEFNKFIIKHEVGYSYETEKQLNDILRKLATDIKDSKRISENCKCTYREHFDFDHVYNEFADHIINLYN